MEILGHYHSADSTIYKNTVLEVREKSKGENSINYFVLKNNLNKEQVELKIKDYFENVRKKTNFGVIILSTKTFKDIKDLSYIKI